MEVARNYGRFADWLPSATPEQRALIDFIQEDWLRMAVWTGRAAEIKYDALQQGKSGGADDKEIREAEAEAVRGKARYARSRLGNALAFLAGEMGAWTKRLTLANAASTTDEPVADSIVALANLAEEMLKDTPAGMVARKAKSKLTAEAIKGYRALAAELSAAGKAAAAVRKAPEVTQAQVDLWDGLAMTFLEQFVETIEVAHEQDPAIPAPSIIGLRSWFRRGGGRTQEGGAGEEPGPGEGGTP